MKVLYESKFVEISLIEEKKLLVQNWSKCYAKFDPFKEAIDKTVEFFKTYKIEKLLSDTSIQPIVGSEGSDYAASKVPELMNNGMKKMAFVMSPQNLSQLGVKNFTAAANAPFIFHFDNQNDAIKWLEQISLDKAAG